MSTSYKAFMDKESISGGQLLKKANQLKRAGKLDEAIALYHQIIEINPNFAWAYNNLGDAFAQQGRLDEAISYYSKSLNINPNSAWLFYRLGEALAQQGDLETAIGYLKKAIEIRPSFEKFHNSLTQVLARQSSLLEKLYSQHEGKVSDKWSSYLPTYDLVLKSRINTNVRLLEIGVQNGGSLEIWSEYFPTAKLIVGCDINPECAELNYEDPRIRVIIGDANNDKVRKNIIGLCQRFDVIIDDGSHKSSDIVKSFATYFPFLEDRGVYIVEDMHTSYWKNYQGGLFYPFSSITFFKHLVDIINYEHWGIEKKASDILNGFFDKYGLKIDPIELQKIHSITFHNSLCVINKCKREYNNLGKRCVTGRIDKISQTQRKANNTYNTPENQKGNEWSTRNLPPGEELLRNLEV
ncbi:MAG: tetratricopeptide repeat protein [Trichodesmium sp. MAG_R04]|nr:tetratricopeptide repeat protein [Trichodesmium sp. MAG_R04]